MSTDTIPGGAYKTSDGRWVNAQGKPIPEPKNLPNMFEDVPEPVDPVLRLARQVPPGDEYKTPEVMITDSPADKPKARRKSKEDQ
jgi:hypothetical protein